MNDQIGDKAAIAFAADFYKALAGDRTIEDAYNSSASRFPVSSPLQ
ncbi:hypothetical protein [Fischerella sp. JS2]|nr:hypothetical protein [Fischerella sp. JS2]